MVPPPGRARSGAKKQRDPVLSETQQSRDKPDESELHGKKHKVLSVEPELPALKKKKSVGEAEKSGKAAVLMLGPGAATARLLLGAHVSGAGGLHRAFENARAIGASSLALFVRNQRRWESKPLADAEAAAFRQAWAESGLSPEAVVPHGSYLINCASPDPGVRKRSEVALVDELDRCRRLGIVQYNLHPGSAGVDNPDRPAAIARLAASLAGVLAAVPGVRLLLENSAGQGGSLGGRFGELGDILRACEAAGADPDRLGVCLDTCHAFAYGYDLATGPGLDAALAELDAALRGVGGRDGGSGSGGGGGFSGLRWRLRAVHLNDSVGGLGCRRDRHADIGAGQLGAGAFKRLLRHPALSGCCSGGGDGGGLPMVLETPGVATYGEQLRLLRRLRDDDDGED